MSDSQMHKEVRDIAVELARNTEKTEQISEALTDIRDNLSRMNKILFVGNGQKSIVARVEGNEVNIVNVQHKLSKIEDVVDVVAVETKRIDRKHSLGLIGLILVFTLVIFDYTQQTNLVAFVINTFKGG